MPTITFPLLGSNPTSAGEATTAFSLWLRHRVLDDVILSSCRSVSDICPENPQEQLNGLMKTLNSTQPHFIRCIIPNEFKQPGEIAKWPLSKIKPHTFSIFPFIKILIPRSPFVRHFPINVTANIGLPGRSQARFLEQESVPCSLSLSWFKSIGSVDYLKCLLNISPKNENNGDITHWWNL